MADGLAEARARMRDNPFYVLGLRPGASRADIERDGQKLLGMLELDLAAAATYATPLGPAPRTAEKVRAAMAELRDPERRLRHELWAQLDPQADAGTAAPAPRPDPATSWPEALAALGWGPPR